MHDRPGVNATRCAAGMTIPVPPGDYFDRKKGTSQTLEKGIAFDGFLGSVTTGFTMHTTETTGTGVAEHWDNYADHERLLCGDKDYPVGDTRVVSLP